MKLKEKNWLNRPEVHGSTPNEIKQLIKNPLQLQDLYFIEINPMPTVWINNAFSHSFTAIQKSDLFYNYIQQLDNFVPESNLHNFLLSSAMFALSKAM